MTELEKMKHAQKYILALANGADPVTGEELPEDTCLNNVRLSRCFFYVADILEQVIKNGGQAGGKYRGTEFILTDEFKVRLTHSEAPLQITEFVRSINEIAMEYGMERMPVTTFTEWLIEQGYLEEVTLADNKRRKEPTTKGRSFGITTEQRIGRYGEYKAVFYSPGVQKFMLEHIDEIVAMWKKRD